MDRDILIVSTERPLFEDIEKACKNCCPSNISLSHVPDSRTTADRLRSHSIALVVIAKLPDEESTISLLFYIWSSFPDVPILNIAGDQEFPESLMIEEEGIALRTGQTALPMHMWPEVIKKTLHREEESGFLLVNDVSNFAQMIENEVRTCILRIIDHSDSRLGILFFEKGKLKNARLKTVQGEIAAYAILSWENVKITVQDSCDISPPKIRSNLQAMLIRSQVKKDHQEMSISNSSTWIEAAQEEKKTYRKLLKQLSAAQVNADKKVILTPTPPTPVESKRGKIGRIPIAALIAIGLALIAAVIYWGNAHFNRSAVERSAVPQQVFSNITPTQDVKAPPKEMKSKPLRTKIIKEIPPSESPPLEKPSTATPTKNAPKPVSEPLKTVSPNNPTTNKVTGDKTTSTLNQKTPDLTTEPSAPLSPPKNLEKTQSGHETQTAQPPPAGTAALNSKPPSNPEPANPEPAGQETTYSVYLHYTYHENRSLAYSLADHLLAANFKVPRIEHAAYKKNDIRFFHTADQGLANQLKSEVVVFLKDKFPGKSGVQFRMKSLAKRYPNTPRGQLEIWLNLPGK